MKKETPTSDDNPTPHWQAVETALGRHEGKKRQARRALGRRRGPEQRAAKSPEPPVLFVTDTIARQTLQLLESPRAERPVPGAVYWFGFALGEQACVTTLLIPDEETRDDAILASAVANEEVFSAVISASLAFLAHVRLAADKPKAVSLADVRFEGAFLLDVQASTPASAFLDPGNCRVHRRIDGKCVEIEPGKRSRHLRLIPGFKDLRSL